jgi:hypothetical protein
VKTVYASGLSVKRIVGTKLEQQVRLADIKATIYITDARVAVACSKYDKGGGWRGGSLAVPVMNLASKARAASRRRGKMLVGHVRYPWMSTVGFSERTGMSTSDALRLGVREKVEGVSRATFLDITFPKGTDTASIASLIAKRTACYRLAHSPDLEAEARSTFEALSQGAQRRAEPKKFVFFEMPSYFFVSKVSAYPTTAVPSLTEPLSGAPATAPAVSPFEVPPSRIEPQSVGTDPRMLAAPAVPSSPAPLEPLVLSPSAPMTIAPSPLPRPTVVSDSQPTAKWGDDPYGRHLQRYWDGSTWSEHVADDGIMSIDRWPR